MTSDEWRAKRTGRYAVGGSVIEGFVVGLLLWGIAIWIACVTRGEERVSGGNGLPELVTRLNNASQNLIPPTTFNPDGEGRIASTSVTGYQNPLTSVSYNVYSEPTALNLGSGDSDSYTYDPNTGRMTQYKFTVTGSSLVGNLQWNPNGTLQQNAITDPFNGSNQQTCNYTYDDLARLASANCGSIWSQLFSPDPFGNVRKSGTITFQPGFNTSTNRPQLGSFDANGNTTSDTVNTYSWDSDGNPVTVNSINITFDAMDRMVELNNSGSYTQILYNPQGQTFAFASNQAASYVNMSLPGGTMAVENGNGPWLYRHGDWLGSVRLVSLPSGSSRVWYDGAFGPYGENYAEQGEIDRTFTGQGQAVVNSGSYPLYDFLMREYHPVWGRWVSPDPAGLGAVNPANPQSWNRYAYVTNNPLALTDPTGLQREQRHHTMYVNGTRNLT